VFIFLLLAKKKLNQPLLLLDKVFLSEILNLRITLILTNHGEALTVAFIMIPHLSQDHTIILGEGTVLLILGVAMEAMEAMEDMEDMEDMEAMESQIALPTNANEWKEKSHLSRKNMQHSPPHLLKSPLIPSVKES
jgi:hypothetical protein